MGRRAIALDIAEVKGDRKQELCLAKTARLVSGIFSSLFGGEGFVLRIEGEGKITLQTRNVSALTSWINARLR